MADKEVVDMGGRQIPHLLNVFWFHVGTIKSDPTANFIDAVSGFQFLDSSMKGALVLGAVVYQFLFQFLYGAIKKFEVEFEGKTTKEFQFLTGTIERK